LIDAKGLLIIIGILIATGFLIVMLAAAAWTLRKYYVLLQDLSERIARSSILFESASAKASQEIIEALQSLSENMKALAKLPSSIDDFSRYTKGHTLAAIKHAAAVESFTKGVELFSKNLFRIDDKENTFQIPSEEQVSREYDIAEILRENPGMDRPSAESIMKAGNEIGVE
jgi:hypothetical protein